MVRPIDMNQGITQAYATEKVQKVQQEHPDMQQRYFSLQLQEEKKRQSEKVPDAEEAKKKIIDVHQEKKQEGNKKESDKNPNHVEDGHDDGSGMMPDQGAHIDIKA